MAATINILSGQQADIEVDTSGFTTFLGGGGSLTRDTSASVHGASSLKVVMDGGSGFEFVTAQVLAASWQPGTQYTASWYIKTNSANAGKTLRYFVDSSGGAISPTSGVVTLTTSWQRISVTFTTPNPITFSWAGPRLDTGGTEAVTFWIDCLQVNAGPLAPWVPGGANPHPPYMAYVAGIPVDLMAGTLKAENQIGQRSQGSLGVWSNLGIIWQYGTQVQIYDDAGALAYAGYTTKDKVKKANGARQGIGFLEHDLQLMDNCYRADKRRVFKYYLGQTAGYIVNDLLGSYLAAEGVTATPTSIATGPTITEVRWSGSKNVSEALTWLAQQAGYWWNIDLNGVLWFQPYGAIAAPFALDGTQADSMQDLSVEAGNDMYVNKQFVKGAYAEKGSKTNQLHETFHGNGTVRSFTLSYPVSRIFQVLLDGVDVTANSLTKGQTGGQFYYATGDPIVAQDPGQTILVSGDTLDVFYAGRYPVISSAQNPALIAAQRTREGGGTGLVESSYSNSKVRSLSAAFQIASALLTHYGQDTTILTFSTRQKGLQSGQMLQVNLPDFALNNKQMLISDVTIDDQGPDGYAVWFHVTAVGSPVESAQWQTFFQNLMNQSSDPSDFTDTSDTDLALLSATTVTRTPVVSVTQLVVQSPICGVTSGPHTMVCGQWTTS